MERREHSFPFDLSRPSYDLFALLSRRYALDPTQEKYRSLISPRSDASQPPASLDSLPNELVGIIVGCCYLPEQLALCQVSFEFFELAAPTPYENVQLDVDQASSFLNSRVSPSLGSFLRAHRPAHFSSLLPPRPRTTSRSTTNRGSNESRISSSHTRSSWMPTRTA